MEDHFYMQRCLQLARQGQQNAKPNPMVGAVIVAREMSMVNGQCSMKDRIIGEGYHVRCGEGHAEVNAFAAVSAADEALLGEATLYVSLEPCSHYGKTPPCADLIIKKGVRRVVIGCQDDFAAVAGRGIEKLRQAGIDVTVGVMEQECRWLNRRFFTFHRLQRPYIILKWAQTANGFIDDHFQPIALSTPFTQMLSHKMRAEEDAILVGRITNEREHPQLTVRHWSGGPHPRRLVVDRQHPLNLRSLYDHGVQSLIVEGGRATLQSFIDNRKWDELRVETAPVTVTDGTPAPSVPAEAAIINTQTYDGNTIRWYCRQ